MYKRVVFGAVANGHVAALTDINLREGSGAGAARGRGAGDGHVSAAFRRGAARLGERYPDAGTRANYEAGRGRGSRQARARPHASHPSCEYIDPRLLLAAPEIFLLAWSASILVVDLFLRDAHRIWTYGLTQAALIGTHRHDLRDAAATTSAYTFSGMFVDDPMADVLKIFGLPAVAVDAGLLARLRRAARHVPRRVLRARAVRDARHDGHDLGEPLAGALSRARADDAVAVRHGRAAARFRRSAPRRR